MQNQKCIDSALPLDKLLPRRELGSLGACNDPRYWAPLHKLLFLHGKLSSSVAISLVPSDDCLKIPKKKESRAMRSK